MSQDKIFNKYVFGALLLGIVQGAFLYRYLFSNSAERVSAGEAKAPIVDGTMPVRVSEEARKNMGILSKALKAEPYHRQIDVPGTITDRPGVSDRGVVAPVTGIVTKIHAYPGNTVAPKAPLWGWAGCHR